MRFLPTKKKTRVKQYPNSRTFLAKINFSHSNTTQTKKISCSFIDFPCSTVSKKKKVKVTSTREKVVLKATNVGKKTQSFPILQPQTCYTLLLKINETDHRRRWQSSRECVFCFPSNESPGARRVPN